VALERLGPQIRAVDLHDVIGDQDRLCLALSRAQAVEIGGLSRLRVYTRNLDGGSIASTVPMKCTGG
jgi:hypothetical protein